MDSSGKSSGLRGFLWAHKIHFSGPVFTNDRVVLEEPWTYLRGTGRRFAPLMLARVRDACDPGYETHDDCLAVKLDAC